MTLGEKMRQARLEAGLSQGQLSQGLITRNMLSQIENGSARPSLSTLQALSSRLGKNVLYFLEESTPQDAPSQLEPARKHFAAGDWQAALTLLETLAENWEQQYLCAFCHLQLGEAALAAGKPEAAADHFRKAQSAGQNTPYFHPALQLHTTLLAARINPTELPEEDSLLLLRADAAITAGDFANATALLECVQNPGGPGWHFVKGKLSAAQRQWATAAAHFRLGESWNPKAAWQQLEVCARESGDFQSAYFYACKLRDL